MDIGAIGWWDHDNQGDLAMLSALRQGLAPHHVVPIATGFPAHPDTVYRLNRLDYVILGGGTLIPGKPTAPFDTFDRWADQLECPLGIAGLGVDPFPERHWPAVEALLDRSEFFFVRDRASHILLEDHPKVQVAPDLTFACPLPPRENRPGDGAKVPVCGVNLRRWANSDPQPWLDALQHLPVQLKGIALSSFEVFDEAELLRQLDPDSTQGFDAALYHQLDLLIGTAFHSILFAVQAAVPVIAIGYAPKVQNFMEELGLAQYLLAPDEAHKLPELVADVLANQPAIVDTLRDTRARLHRDAQQNMKSIREQVEQRGPRHQRNGPTVTIVVIGSGNAEADQRTLDSCSSQTYENVEVCFSTGQDRSGLPPTAGASQVTSVAAEPQMGRGARLQQALTLASGEYLTWVDGGDWFADDALDCLADRLEHERPSDAVYADYYAIGESNLPLGYHTVPGPEKLYRRDVVGPCFLLRRSWLARVDLPSPDMPLVAYSLWLQAESSGVLAAFHAPLFYSARQIKSRAFLEQEREARRRWRQTQPAWSRAMWSVIDSDLGERLVVEPLRRLRDVLRRNHA